MNMQVIFGYLRILIVFSLVWVGFWVGNNVGCRTVDGSEMEPTLKKEKLKLVSKSFHKASELKVGDFVCYAVLQGTKERIASARIVALPGDRVRVEKGEVFVNSVKTDSNYVPANQRSPEDNYPEIVVPREHFYALGDSRKVALSQRIDSRWLGPIGQWALLGKF